MVSWPKWSKQGEGGAEAEQPVVHLTETAQQKLLEVLGARAEGGALRISVQNPGFGAPTYGMALEPSATPQPGDAVVQAGGITVLVDMQSLPEVNGATVDFVDDPLRPGFKVDPPGTRRPAEASAPPPAPRPDLDLSHPLVATVQAVIEQQINPGIATHGGRATLIDVKDDVAYVELGGGCVGCSLASVTLKQGVEQLIRQAVPQIRQVVDVTDHAAGSNPYYTSAKDAQSPFAQAAKG